MRIDLDRQHFYLDQIGDVEWFMLVQLPDAADFRQSPKGYRRLLPDPVQDPGPDDPTTADWKEFIQPDLEAEFTRFLEQVAGDIDAAEELTDAETGEIFHRVVVPLERAETWYFVLNQARLVMNEEHDVSGIERELFQGQQSPTEIEEKKWLILVQYRVYAAVQEFILSQIME